MVDVLSMHISQLTKEIESFLQTIADSLPPTSIPNGNAKLARAILQINNFSAILTILHERLVHPEDIAVFEALLKSLSETYTSIELELFFKPLVSWVKSVEGTALEAAQAAGHSVPTKDDNGNPIVPRFPESQVVVAPVAETEALVKEFGLNWRANVKNLADHLLKFFPDTAHTGGVLFRHVMGSLYLTFERFDSLARRAFSGAGGAQQPSFMRDMVQAGTLYQEMQRYGRSFQKQ
jgi:hypothetical protein